MVVEVLITAVDINTPVDLSIDESTITVTPADCNGNGIPITIDHNQLVVITGGLLLDTGDYSNRCI